MKGHEARCKARPFFRGRPLMRDEIVDQIFHLVAKVLSAASILLLAVLISTNCLEIIMRTFFHTSFSWILETNIAIASAIYFFGAAVVYHNSQDISSTIVIDKIPSSIRGIYFRAISIISGLIFCAVAWYAWSLVQIQYPFVTPGVGFPRIIYSVPLLLCVVVIGFECIWRGIRSRNMEKELVP